MSSTKKTIIQLFVTLAFMLSLASTSVFAASDCKDESEKACSKKDSCSWVKSHKRKDGAKVKAYCRSKPKKGKKLTTKKSTAKAKTIAEKKKVKQTADSKKTTAKAKKKADSKKKATKPKTKSSKKPIIIPKDQEAKKTTS